MAIWIPTKLYIALPLLCLMVGVVFLLGSSGAANFCLSVVLIAYACYVLGVRFWSFMEDTPRWG